MRGAIWSGARIKETFKSQPFYQHLFGSSFHHLFIESVNSSSCSCHRSWWRPRLLPNPALSGSSLTFAAFSSSLCLPLPTVSSSFCLLLFPQWSHQVEASTSHSWALISPQQSDRARDRNVSPSKGLTSSTLLSVPRSALNHCSWTSTCWSERIFSVMFVLVSPLTGSPALAPL